MSSRRGMQWYVPSVGIMDFRIIGALGIGLSSLPRQAQYPQDLGTWAHVLYLSMLYLELSHRGFTEHHSRIPRDRDV